MANKKYWKELLIMAKGDEALAKKWLDSGMVPMENYFALLRIFNSYYNAATPSVNAEFKRLEKHSLRELEVQKRRDKIIKIINSISPKRRKQMNKTQLRYYIIDKMGLKESEDETIRKDLQFLQREGNKF